MSYTVIIDEQDRERRFENRLNATVRHCRIGRVRHKVKPADVWPGISGITAPARPKKDTFFINPYEQIATWRTWPVMDHPRNCGRPV